MNNKPLFSIVTICYNAGNLITKTIESVIAQKTFFRFPDLFKEYDSLFEYIIQDGASSDNTLSIVNEYISSFNEKGISLTINSLKDEGIYDAMNKAVQSSKGEYIIFMNADDCFYSDHVLIDVFESLKNSENITSSGDIYTLPDIIYGDCIVKELGMYFKFRKCYDQIKTRMPFSHQACFARRECLEKWPLDLQYPITADYDFLLKCHLNNCVFFDCNIIISLVTADGVSSVNMYDAFTEACKVCSSYGVPRYSGLEIRLKVFEMRIKQFVLDCFPKSIKKTIRKYQVTHRGQTYDATIPEWANI